MSGGRLVCLLALVLSSTLASRLPYQAAWPLATLAPSHVLDPPRVRVSYVNLTARSFGHPYEKRLSRRFVWARPFCWLSGCLGGSSSEAYERIELLGSSVRAGPRQMGHAYVMLQEACRILGLDSAGEGQFVDPPELYIQQGEEYTAKVLVGGEGGEGGGEEAPRMAMIVTTALLRDFTAAEVQLVMGRELGRALCGGKWWASDGMAQLATYATDFWENTFARLPFSDVLDKLLTILRKPAEDYIHDSRRRLEWCRELSADRAGLLVAQDLDVVLSMTLRLLLGTRHGTSLPAFLEQVNELDAQTSKKGPRISCPKPEASPHTVAVLRAVELSRFSRSEEYQTLRHQALASSRKARPIVVQKGPKRRGRGAGRVVRRAVGWALAIVAVGLRVKGVMSALWTGLTDVVPQAQGVLDDAVERVIERLPLQVQQRLGRERAVPEE